MAAPARALPPRAHLTSAGRYASADGATVPCSQEFTVSQRNIVYIGY